VHELDYITNYCSGTQRLMKGSEVNNRWKPTARNFAT